MIDEKRIADFFAELVSIDSPSLEERELAEASDRFLRTLPERE